METRQNTLKLTFVNKTRVPSYLEVLRFVAKDLKVPASLVHSIYKDENEQSYYFKFMDKESFNLFFERSEDQYRFQFADGQSEVVRFDMASRQMKYIRIFNLPPEAEEKDIEKVMGKYGKVRQHVRERYPASAGFPVYSGIRGVHMELETEVPASLYISHFRARIYYDGLKNRCFFCKTEGHVKVNCPKLAEISAADSKEERRGDKREESGSKRLYSQIAANLKVAGAALANTSATMTSLPLPPTRADNVVTQQPPAKDPESSPPSGKTPIIDDWNEPIDEQLSVSSFESDDLIENDESIGREHLKESGDTETGAGLGSPIDTTTKPMKPTSGANDAMLIDGFGADSADGTNTNATTKRAGEEIDDDSEGKFTVVGKVKRGTPLQVLRDRPKTVYQRKGK